jgi:uncharacterized membrane protein
MVRRLLKFLHSVGAAGLTGAAGALIIVLMLAPASAGGPGCAQTVVAMSKIAGWIIGPSILLTVATGLLAMVANPVFQDLGWVWAKAATGILVLLGGLHVIGPLQEEAKRVASGADTGSTALLVDGEIGTLWVLLAVAVANIALGVWRPRFPSYPV